ncbi:uncharacterized protein LOC132315909 isoform X2 [Cornus florida]|uniref:uncharacterized protein LOC132315909 isoform X2 n=1 Tax=Cornus florida TaxID=4283 RepID=UPI002898AD52|nr:uncharacterized protein LOC132315909 isoform X2 [Cornus florida]
MSDHLVLCADRLITSATLESMRRAESDKFAGPFEEGTSTQIGLRSNVDTNEWGVDEFSFSDKEEAGERTECRICQEEDLVRKMEAPCACSGSLKFTHRKCVQQWCNEKKNTTCEICNQPYQAGYTAPSPLHIPRSEDTTVDISESLTYTGTTEDVHSPTLAAAAAELLLDGEYGECTTATSMRTAIVRSTVLILMAITLMKHALSIVDEEDADIYNLLSVFLLRTLAFLMPVYLMTWVATLLLRRHQGHQVD